jgi:bifunctional non-homologous end joining protein LigD
MSTIVADPFADLAADPGMELVPVPYVPRTLPFDDPAWVFQPKYQGMRGFVVNTPLGCEVRSPRELRRERVVELRDRLRSVLGKRRVVLDGEVVAIDREGRPSFRDLLRGRSLLAFGAFDLLWLDGEDLRDQPLGERQRRLTQLLPNDTGPLYKMFMLEEHGRALFEAARRLELEGILARRKQDPYGPGTVWYTIRNPDYTLDDGRIDLFRHRPRTRRPDREPAGS